ncbi:class F sortase [Arthrobacter sp. 9AX]|uniref:class F sortase n=1 Tax=Arthrobacter sp. 9AX TaxID=2653131 RepID=UPI00135AFE5A|nr:class F sortase [Arthrobacter sp. 9AX]
MHLPLSDPAEVSADVRRGRILSARSILFVFLCGLLAYVVFAAPALLSGQSAGPAAPTVAETQLPAATAPAGNTPLASPPTATPSTAPVPAGPPAASPQHLLYPAAGIDVVVNPLEPTAEDKETQTIVPPATMDGYWLTPYGSPGAGSTNTTYIVGHSWQDRDAPFNHLSTRAAAGDRLTVATGTGELVYQVDSVTTYVKSGLKDSPIWEVAPNRIVLISCYTDDPWGTNVVVVASPAAG